MIFKDSELEIRAIKENGKYILQEKDLKTKVISELYQDDVLKEFETEIEADLFLNSSHTWVEWKILRERHRVNKYLRMNSNY